MTFEIIVNVHFERVSDVKVSDEDGLCTQRDDQSKHHDGFGVSRVASEIVLQLFIQTL